MTTPSSTDHTLAALLREQSGRLVMRLSRVFGDFALEADVTVGELAEGYGFGPGGRDPRQSLVDAVAQEFDGAPTVGDRLPLGPVDVIVRALDEHGRVAELGLHLAPPRRGWRRRGSWLMAGSLWVARLHLARSAAGC